MLGTSTSTGVRDIDFVSVTRHNDVSDSFWNYPDSVVILVSPLVVRYNFYIVICKLSYDNNNNTHLILHERINIG